MNSLRLIATEIDLHKDTNPELTGYWDGQLESTGI